MLHLLQLPGLAPPHLLALLLQAYRAWPHTPQPDRLLLLPLHLAHLLPAAGGYHSRQHRQQQ
jgi:hypothetical protein